VPSVDNPTALGDAAGDNGTTQTEVTGMTRVILAAIGGVIVGAVLAGGISLLAFTYPLQAEITNFPRDESGAVRVGGAIEATLISGTPRAGEPTALPAAWSDGQTLQCVCSERR
jgi:hypothetical protein